MQPSLLLTISEATEVEKAFRHMQKGTHIGKILVKIPEDPGTLPAASERIQFPLRPDTYYLLVGGLGGIGRTFTTWMVSNGARNLIFLSRTVGQTESDQAFLTELENQSCVARAVAGDVTNQEDVQKAVSLGPVSGVVQMAAVLQVSSLPVYHSFADSVSAGSTPGNDAV